MLSSAERAADRDATASGCGLTLLADGRLLDAVYR